MENRTIEQFYEFFHCLMIYYTSTKFHLPSFLHLGDTGGRFNPPPSPVSNGTKTTLVF